MSGTAAPQRSTRQQEALTPTVRDQARAAQRSNTKASEGEFAKIGENAFFKIMFNEGTTPQAKRDALAQALSFTGTKQQARQAVSEFEQFKEFLQATREEMSRETIKLVDTEAMGELQSGYRDFNNGIIEFEEAMQPLTDIIDAVYKLRTNGKTLEIFKLIRDNREAEKVDLQKLGDLAGRIAALEDQIKTHDVKIAELREVRGFLGFGDTKPAAKAEIAGIEVTVASLRDSITKLNDEVSAIEQARTDRRAAGGEYTFEMDKLAELLDLTSDQHKDRQQAVVQKALNFVMTTKERTGSIRSHLNKMTDQIDSLFDGNQNMNRVYAMMTDALRIAESENQKKRQELDAAASATEDEIEKNLRDEKRMAIEQHMTALDAATNDTLTTAADLTSATIRIKDMRDANSNQLAKVRQMQGQGVAGIAERLSQTLNAVSAAAIGESQALAKDSMANMKKITDTISQKETIRNSMQAQEVNDDLIRALDELSSFGDTTRTAMEINRAGVREMRDNFDRLKAMAADVREDIQASIAVNADVSADREGTASADKSAKPAGSSFGLPGV